MMEANAAGQGPAFSEGLGAWQPIETAPEGRLVVVGWLDAEDAETPERHDFDWIEDGCWTRHADHVEYAGMVAPHGSRMPPQCAPYTHWLDLPAIPRAPNVRGNLAETAAQEVEKCHKK